MIRCSALALASVVALAAAAGRADELRDEARAHYALGRIEFGKARYDRALTEFRASYAVAPIPDLLYDIGRCQEEQGDRAGAVRSFRQYLAAKPGAEERADLEAHIAQLERDETPPRPIVARPAGPAVGAVERTPPSRPVWRRGWFWGVLAGGVVVAAAAVVLGVLLAGQASIDYGFPPISVARSAP